MNTQALEKDVHSADVIPFKLNNSTPSTTDWLRALPDTSWFVSKGIANKSGWLDSFGIAAVMPECILLASRNQAGFYDYNWVDSEMFSKVNIFVARLPTPEGKPEEATEEKESPDG